MRKAIALLILVVLISGCSLMYIYCQYQPLDIWGCGYRVAKIQDNLYSISFTGSQNDNIQRIKDFTLLRSADTTLENGYKYFVITEDGYGGTNYGTTGQAFTHGNLNTYGNTGTYSGTATGYAVTQQRNTVTSTIQCFKDKPEDAKIVVYDAEQIATNLRKAYGIK